MPRIGLEAPEKGARPAAAAHRRCILTGAVQPTTRLIRFVVGPDGGIVTDVAGDLPGRGLWLSASRDVVDTARAKGLFARAARRPVGVAADLADVTEALLARRCLDLLGLGRRAGTVASGFEQVRALIHAGKAAVVVVARDGSPDSRVRMRKVAGGLLFTELFGRAELSLALGRENVVHAALAPGKLTDRFWVEVARLTKFRSVGGAESGAAAEPS